MAGLAVQETTVHCPYLIGERIYLRPLERADAPIVQPWINDPEIRHNIRRYQPVISRARRSSSPRLTPTSAPWVPALG